jgi:Dolichyl-phosphate-mannose-protein mannosyltransferase
VLSRVPRLTTQPIQPAAALVPLALAAVLAMWGLGFGLPYLFRPDEEVMVGRSVRMVAEHSLDPLFYIYPPLPFYLLACAEGVTSLLGHPLGPASQYDPTTEYLAGRAVSAVALVACTAFVYLTGKAMWGRAAGFLSAMCLALAPVAVRQAHFATPDSVAMALAGAAMWMGRRAASRRPFLFTGVLCGLAAATKYTAGVVVVFPLVLALYEEDRRGRVLALFGGASLAFGVVFSLAGHPAEYLHGVAFLAGRASTWNGQLPIGLLYHPTASLPLGLGLGTYGLALGGVLISLLRRQRTDVALLCFLLAFFAVVGFSHEVFYRYVLPAVPALCLLAGSVMRLVPAVGAQRALLLAVALLLQVPSAYVSVATDRLLSEKDTRQQAAEWLLRNAPAGSGLRMNSYWVRPFYDGAQLPNYPAGDRLADSFQQGLFTDRFEINGRGGACFSVTGSGPPWQSPVPHTGRAPVAVFRPYEGPAPTGSVYDPIDSFYLPIWGFSHIQRPGPSIVITENCSP